MDMVEKVARAMAPMFADASNYWCAGTKWPDCTAENCGCKLMAFSAARAAIEAMKEPTGEMLQAANDAMSMKIVQGPERFNTLRIGYAAAIDAALSPRTSPEAPSSE